MSERSISSSGGNSPSLPSHGSVGLIFGNAAPLTGAVDPRPNERSLENNETKSVFFSYLYSNITDKCFTTERVYEPHYGTEMKLELESSHGYKWPETNI